jgi:hypothetical protein
MLLHHIYYQSLDINFRDDPVTTDSTRDLVDEIENQLGFYQTLTLSLLQEEMEI